MNGSVVSMGVSVAVQYLGEGVSWTDVVGVKGVRDAKESVSCEVSVCEMVSRRSGRSGRFVRRRCSGSLQWRLCLQGMSSLRRVLVRL